MNFPTLGGNWVDLVIFIIVIFFVIEAFHVGPWAVIANFISFLLTLLVSLTAYQFIAQVLRENFTLSHSTSNAVGFFLMAIITGGILGFITMKVAGKIPIKYWKRWWSKALAIIPAAGEGLILTAFVLTLSLALPISPRIKTDITNSKIGGAIVRQTLGLEALADEIFGGVIEDSLTYLTVNPESRESIPITYDRLELRIDEVTENEMFNLVNSERREKGVKELAWRERVVSVARDHARDMWERSYFGHVSPEEEDVGDRLVNEEVKFIIAGENLALAPTLATAHTGLMNSQDHRENILDDKFSQIGIGVIDNGVYGKMFVQIFTD